MEQKWACFTERYQHGTETGMVYRGVPYPLLEIHCIEETSVLKTRATYMKSIKMLRSARAYNIQGRGHATGTNIKVLE
jgi:hypothetical protein